MGSNAKVKRAGASQRDCYSATQACVTGEDVQHHRGNTADRLGSRSRAKPKHRRRVAANRVNSGATGKLLKAVALEYSHPQVAFRSCDHCRKYVYDEETGKPRESRGVLLERVKPPPCETDQCPKGHWSAPIEIKRKHLPIVQIAQEVRATGGASLNQTQASDRILMHAIARINAIHEAASQRSNATQIAAILSSIIAMAGKHGR